MTKKFISGVFILLVWVQGTSVVAQTSDSKTLRVGAVLSLTGDAANNGEAIRKGLTLASEELIQKGWTIDLDFQDDGTKTGKTASSVHYLLANGYRFFVGPTWSFLTNAAKPVLEKSGALALVPAGSSDVNGGSSRAIFNLCPRRKEETSKVSEWLKSRSYKKALILTPLGDWGTVHRDVFQRAAAQNGIEIVRDEEFDYGIDPGALKTLLLKAKSKGADLLLTTASGSDLSNIIKARGNLQWGADMLTTEDLWDAIDEGLVSSEDTALNNIWVIGLPLNSAFSKRFHERFKETPRMYADRAYDALMLLAKAVEATDGAPDSVRAFLLGGNAYSGVTGEIKFNNQGDRSSEEYKVMRAINNKERA